jgi:DNA-binding transcriptional ArsR family regulator
MSREAPPPLPVLPLTDDARIRGYVHPVRMTILRMLAQKPRTVTSVAREMGVHPANITHHFRRLCALGLARLVESRDTGRNLEKYYRAAARSFVVRPRARGALGKQALALAILRDNLSLAVDRRRDEPGEVLALLGTARIVRGDFARFARRLQALLREFRRADSEGGTSYGLNLSLYPDGAGTAPRTAGSVRIE